MTPNADWIHPEPQKGPSVMSGLVDLRIVELVQREAGVAPPPTIVTTNPLWEKWRERAALILCVEAEECGRIPTPCTDHLRLASEISNQMHMRVTNG